MRPFRSTFKPEPVDTADDASVEKGAHVLATLGMVLHRRSQAVKHHSMASWAMMVCLHDLTRREHLLAELVDTHSSAAVALEWVQVLKARKREMWLARAAMAGNAAAAMVQEAFELMTAVVHPPGKKRPKEQGAAPPL